MGAEFTDQDIMIIAGLIAVTALIIYLINRF